MELAFAGLQQLCAPLMDRIDELPEPQREALAVAFGRGVGPTPDRFLVGLAVLSLMAAAPNSEPLLSVVDAAQGLGQVPVPTLPFLPRPPSPEPVPTADARALTAPACACGRTGGHRGVVSPRGGQTGHSGRRTRPCRSCGRYRVRSPHALSPPVDALGRLPRGRSDRPQGNTSRIGRCD